MQLKIYGKEIVQAEYFRTFNMVAISLIDLRDEWQR